MYCNYSRSDGFMVVFYTVQVIFLCTGITGPGGLDGEIESVDLIGVPIVS